jgi:hypothetical protein
MAVLAVFAVFCSELPTSGISFRRKTWAAAGSANKITAKPRLFRRCFPLFRRRIQGSTGQPQLQTFVVDRDAIVVFA